MLPVSCRTELYERLKARWIQRKAAALELLAKYGGNLPHCAVLQVGSLKISMFVADLIRHTGDRFLEEMMASPASDGIVTISIPEADMPAASLVFSLMDFEVEQMDKIGLQELLDLMDTLLYCNAVDIWDAITACLLRQLVNALDFFALVEGWTRRMQSKPVSEIHFPDGQVQGYVISSVTKESLEGYGPLAVCIIPAHPYLELSLNLMTMFCTKVACSTCPWQL